MLHPWGSQDIKLNTYSFWTHSYSYQDCNTGLQWLKHVLEGKYRLKLPWEQNYERGGYNDNPGQLLYPRG